MRNKPKFKPVVTRIKLNPEQAVLSCSCYQYGWQRVNGSTSVTQVAWYSGTWPDGRWACGGKTQYGYTSTNATPYTHDVCLTSATNS